MDRERQKERSNNDQYLYEIKWKLFHFIAQKKICKIELMKSVMCREFKKSTLISVYIRMSRKDEN